MLGETDRERIRRAFHLEKKSIRQIAKEEGCSRDTIRGAISNDPFKPYQLTRPKPAPVFGPYQLRVEALLGQNERLPRKQRYTAHRIFEAIREEGYQGCESSVRHYISARKIASHQPDVFLPLEFEPGQDAQVDWGEATVIIGGHREKVQLFIMRLCYSRRTFAMTFPTQEQESFLWAHLQAFQHFGGVPHRISYDNLGTAVKLALEKTGKVGRPRQEVRAFVAFRSHYLFESHFCTPGQGHEKGQVEHGVGYTRRNAMVPLPEASSFADLKQRCGSAASRKIAAVRRQMPMQHPKSSQPSSSADHQARLEAYLRELKLPMLFQLISDLYERVSIIVTSNLRFGDWNSIFGDEKMTDALIGRLTHKGHIVEFVGESYRFRHRLQREETQKDVG